MSSTTSKLYIASPDVIPANPSPQVRIVLEWARAVNEFDIDRLSALIIDEGYTHYMSPEHSIKSIGFPTVHRSKESFLQTLKKVLDVLKTPGVFIHEVTEFGNKVIVHDKANGTTKTDQPFLLELLFIFTFGTDSKGELKIVETKEFFDTKYLSEFLAAESERNGQASAGEK